VKAQIALHLSGLQPNPIELGSFLSPNLSTSLKEGRRHKAASHFGSIKHPNLSTQNSPLSKTRSRNTPKL
jgi:hypothetical protein